MKKAIGPIWLKFAFLYLSYVLIMFYNNASFNTNFYLEK